MDTAARAFLLFSRTYNHSFIRRFCQMRPRSIVQNSNTVGAIFRQRWTVVFDSAARRLSSLGKLQSSVPHAAIRSRRYAPCSSVVRCVVSRRSEEHTSELQSLMRISYAVFCLKKKTVYICNDTEN